MSYNNAILINDSNSSIINCSNQQSNVSEKERNPILRRFMDERKQWKLPGYDFDLSFIYLSKAKLIHTNASNML